MDIKDFLLQFVTLPWTPRGRRLRIRKLVKEGADKESAACIVYYRDIERHIRLSVEEIADIKRLTKLLEEGKLVVPEEGNK